MADDLYAPLTRKAETISKLRIGAKPAAAICVLVLGGISAFAMLVKDPLGGEPHQIVAMPSVAKAEAPETPFVTSNPEIDEPLPDLTPKGPSVAIITPGSGQNGQMDIKTVAIPDFSKSTFIEAPDPRVTEKVRVGLLPKIAEDGTRPSKLYARPFERGEGGKSINAPRIAILIGGLGLSQNSTNEAIAKLPAAVTLAFAPYGTQLQALANKAREKGHEVMLQIPMEPFDFPSNDPGPQTLLSALTREKNIERLNWSLSRFAGYTGVVNYLGAKFTSNAATMRPILTELKNRGLTYIDDGSSPRSVGADVADDIKLNHSRAIVTLDVTAAPDKIDEALANLEQEAKNKGSALGVASGLPLTIDRLTRWAAELEKRGMVLVPVSAIVEGDPGS